MLSKLAARHAWLGAIVMALAIVMLAAACGSDATPTPASTPTATPAPPAATPTPPTAAPTPSMAQPEVNLEGFVVTPRTTGKDFLDRISEAENACIRTTFGDAVYQIILATPLSAAGTPSAAIGPLAGCLTLDNVVLLGGALINAQSGGRSEETVQCMTEVAREYPRLIYLRLGLEWTEEDEASHPSETHSYALSFYRCMTPREKVNLLLSLWGAADMVSPVIGSEIIALLPEAEASCIREGLSAGDLNTFLGAPVREAMSMGAVPGCLSMESYVSIFVAVSSARLGGLSEATRGCLADFAGEHDHYIFLAINLGDVASTLTEDEFVERAEDGERIFACLSEDELRNMQISLAETLDQTGFAPAAAPTPPPAASTTSMVQPAVNLEGFVITPETTGKDFLDRISEAESACIRTTFGDAVYQIISSTPLSAAGTPSAAIGPLAGCLTLDNVLLLGGALIHAQSGGRTEETVQCMTEVAREHPELIYLRLGLEWTEEDEASHASDTHSYALSFYRCMTPTEKVNLLLRLWGAADMVSPVIGSEIIALLPEAEASCIREGLSAGDLNTFLGAPVREAMSMGAVPGCLSTESYISIFVTVSSARLGGLSEATRGCLADFAGEHDHYIFLAINLGDVASTLTEDEFVERAEDGERIFACLSEDELRNMQISLAETLDQTGFAPAAAPTPPAAASTTSMVQPAVNLEGFVITPETTGKDFLDRISEAENACIRTTFGDAAYQFIGSTPLSAASSPSAAIRPLVGCLTFDNILLLGGALMNAQFGGRTAETVQCITGIAREHPELLYLLMGLEWTEEEESDHASESHTYILSLYHCMTPMEKVNLMPRLWSTADLISQVAGSEIIALLPEAEASCIREELSAGDLNTFLGAPVREAMSMGPVPGCLSLESYVSIFVTVSSARMGGLSDATRGCLTDFAREHDHYIYLALNLGDVASTLTEEEFVERSEDGERIFACLSEDELQRIQESLAAVLARTGFAP